MQKISRRLWIPFALLTLQILHAQQPKIPLESWEVRMNRRQPPVEIMDAIGLKPGMTIGEIGAGTGRIAIWLAERVGPKGKVLANDIRQSSLDHLKKRCEDNGVKNIHIIKGTVEDPCLPEGALDIAFMINVYHHLDKPHEMLLFIKPSLKPDGILAIVDADPVKSGFGDDHSTPKKEMLQQLDKAGYDVIRVEDFLKEDYIYICQVK